MGKIVRVATLSGGGFRIFTHVGAMTRLHVHPGFQFDAVVGVSAGSICAGFCGWTTTGQWPDRATMIDRLNRLSQVCSGLKSRWDIFGRHGGSAALARKLIPFRLGEDMRNAVGAYIGGHAGAYHMQPLRELLMKEIPEYASWTDRTAVGMVDIQSPGAPYREVCLSGMNRSDGIAAITASCTIPIFAEPVVAPGGKLAVDGGLANVNPLSAGIGMLKVLCGDGDVGELYVLNCAPVFDQRGVPVEQVYGATRTIVDMAGFTVDRLLGEALIDDLRKAHWCNMAARSGTPVRKGQRYFRIYSVDPPAVIPADATSFDPRDVILGLTNGANGAENFLRNPGARLLENLATPDWWGE